MSRIIILLIYTIMLSQKILYDKISQAFEQRQKELKSKIIEGEDHMDY